MQHATSAHLLKRALESRPLIEFATCIQRMSASSSNAVDHSNDTTSMTSEAPPPLPDPPLPSAAAAFDTTHRSPTELVWPMSRHQEKYAGRVYRSLSSVLSQDSSLREELIDQFGFSIKEVRVSPDHAKAFILWDSYNGQAAGAERALRRTTPRLRAAVARAMKARNVPRLEFRLDRVSEQDSELERVFARLEQEREAEERESGILNE